MINWILKNRKFSKLIFLFATFLIALFIVSYFQNRNNEPKVCFGRDCFYVEIVDEENERTQGLMYRENMDKNRGMLFVFDSEGVYPFWMKNTILPLDIIWINSEKEIVYIFEDAQPCKSDPCPIITHKGSALFVVELNAGTVREKKIQVGQTTRFEIQ